MSTARVYWIHRDDLEKGLNSLIYRSKPEEPGVWVEVELAVLAEQPLQKGDFPVRNHLAEHIKGSY